MTNPYFLNKMPEEFSREVKKFRARLDDYLKGEENFKEKLMNFVKKLEAKCGTIEDMLDKPEKLAAFRREIVADISEILKSEGEIMHERSHLLESYGAVILALEKIIQERAGSTGTLSH